MLKRIEWLGHASFKILGRDRVIYIDPWKLKGGELADIVLITHDHYDHCSPEDLKLISKGNTVIVPVDACADKLPGSARMVRSGDSLSVGGVDIEVVPAYNVDKEYHPQEKGYVGFILNVNGQRIYHAGDTDFIPEMEDIRADVALLPIGGTFTMDAAQAARAAHTIKPEVAVPMHWGSIVGSLEDAQRFEELCELRVEILEPKA